MIMKNFNRLFIAAALALPFFAACSTETPDYSSTYPNALVTVKPVSEGIEIPGQSDKATFYLQLDDENALLPTNVSKSPSKLEARALGYIKMSDKLPEGVDKEKFQGTAEIVWIDTILTKKPVEFVEGVDLDKEYGEDPVEIMNNWRTVVEDGYITFEFMTYWGYSGKKHEVNMILGTNPENPYEIVFRHNAHGDISGNQGTGIVAFSLKDLPDTKGEEVDLTLKWQSFSGDKSTKFKYRTRPDWSASEEE